ncbi:MAG: dienelactone hydrolase family protein [Leptolyngbyaceae cyanobacterium bins.349]|nr:dienelactone hydrolase family protein [Leptolyngbyaceae cyanobacterium bins.349]
MTLNAITLPAQSAQPPQGLVILLHGWGANGNDLPPIAELMDLGEYQLTFPEAPFPHPYNPVGKMWYDFPENYSFLGTPEFADRPDLGTSRQLLIDFITMQAEISGIPLARTVLGGFSQGGAMTLDVGTRLPLAGLMVLSGYLHAPLTSEAGTMPPTLVIHGTQDTVVPLNSAHQVRDRLQSLKVPVQYEEYNMGHEIQPLVLRQVQTFIKARLTSH